MTKQNIGIVMVRVLVISLLTAKSIINVIDKENNSPYLIRLKLSKEQIKLKTKIKTKPRLQPLVSDISRVLKRRTKTETAFPTLVTVGISCSPN